ncbi:hypothetical protein D3880_13800 [Pseudomonas cavernae]|uniref:Lipoprotein n=1 Tax=Pseudomonas cavernae TaxID=2320867 RepID=A0A385Z4A1_9PSED|nr:hypothetical protein [Pseudomonas cavernae]AYC33360.1 hypothetical protein D3880_13800 [Pseudomonas cavernae]
MKRFPLLVAVLATLGGCMTNEQFIAQNQEAAIKATTARAAFELNCQSVTPSVLTSKVVETRFGWERTEYTIGVRGCGKQAVYLTYCLNPDNCNAISDSARIQGQ